MVNDESTVDYDHEKHLRCRKDYERNDRYSAQLYEKPNSHISKQNAFL